jgi:hypothetical protein
MTGCPRLSDPRIEHSTCPAEIGLERLWRGMLWEVETETDGNAKLS